MKTIPFLSHTFVLYLLLQHPARSEPLVAIVGQNICSFDSNAPATWTSIVTLSGLDIFEQVHAIERKPGTGQLLVLTNLSGPGGGYKLRSAYSTGTNTVLGSSFVISGSTKWALALQPDNTTLRAVSNNGVNLRLDSATGARTDDAVLAYAAGDPSFGTVPRVGALVTLSNGTTYGVDIANWNLVTLDAAPSGTLHTVGSTGLALTGSIAVNLDVSESSGTVFLSVGNNTTSRTDLYTINLGTGAISSLGQLGNSEVVLALATGVVSAPPPPPAATVVIWDAGRDLARNEKPDTPTPLHNDTLSVNSRVPEWSYGSRSTVAATNLTLYPPEVHLNNAGPYSDAQGFDDNAAHVYANTGTSPLIINNGFGPLLPLRPGELWMHPSVDHRFSVVRWTCPFDREYTLQASWEDMDPYGGNGCTTHIVINGVEVFQHTYGNGGSSATNLVRTLTTGDVVDFMLGTNGNFAFDAARANFTISVAPRDVGWDGSSGGTGTDTNWNPDLQPQRADTVRIETGAPSANSVLNALHLINTRNVTFTNGLWNIFGSLSNEGSLRLESDEVVFHGNIGIYGAGNIFMEGATLDTGDRDLDILFNLGNRIQGYGSIAAMFNNQSNGVVTANNNGSLAIDQPVANHGMMTATADSLLVFPGGHAPLGPIHNDGGIIRALFDGGVFLAGPLSAGTIENQQNDPGPVSGASPFNPEQVRELPPAGVFFGSVDPLGPPAELSDAHGFVTLEGTDLSGNPAEFTLLPGCDLLLDSSLVLNGVLRTYGNTSDGLSAITLKKDVLLTGAGGIELGWAGRQDEITGAGRTLYLGDLQRLAGGGQVRTAVFNGGLINANRSSATEGSYALVFHNDVTSHTFAGASEGGTLRFHGDLNQWSGAASSTGTVMNVSGGRVEFDGSTILGGLLSQTAGEPSFTYHHSVFEGEQSPEVVLAGLHDAGGAVNDTLELRGDIRFQSATLSILNPCSASAVSFAHLSGSGLLWLRHYPDADLIIPGGEQLENEIAIAGLGEIKGGGALINQAAGNIQAYDGILYLYPGQTLNAGVIESGGRPANGQAHIPGTLYVGGEVANSGVLRVNNALSSLTLYEGWVAGGLIETLGTGTGFVVTSGGLEDVQLRNNLRVVGNTRCDLAGTLEFLPGLFPDSYLLAGGTAGQTSDVAVNGTVILDGFGGVWLQDPDLTLGHARLVQGDTNPGTAESVTLRNGARIRGAGLVDVDVYNESGTLLADTPGGNLIIANGRLKPMAAALPSYTPEQITADPLLLLPDMAKGVLQAGDGASVELQQIALSGLQLHGTGTGKVILKGIAPIFSQMHVMLQGASKLIATNGLTLAIGAQMSAVGTQLPGLRAASASCAVRDLPLPTGPSIQVNGLIGNDGSTLVAAGGGNVQSRGADLIGNDGSTLIAGAGGALIGLDGGSLIGNDGSTLIGNDGGTLIGLDGGSLIGNDGSTLICNDSSTLGAVGGGDVDIRAGASAQLSGGSQLTNTATGGMVAAGGLNGVLAATSYVQVSNQGALTSDASAIYAGGGSRNEVMVDN